MLKTVDVVPFLLVFPSAQFNQVICPVKVIPVCAVGDDPVLVGGKQGQHLPGDRTENCRLVLPVEIGADPLQDGGWVDPGFKERC